MRIKNQTAKEKKLKRHNDFIDFVESNLISIIILAVMVLWFILLIVSE